VQGRLARAPAFSLYQHHEDRPHFLEAEVDRLVPQDGRVRDYVGPALTRHSLAELLDREGINEGAYSLFGAHKPEAIVMDQRRDGWVVFYTERGEESDLRRYADEAAACLDLLDRVWNVEHNRFDLVAGPAPPARADADFASWLDDHDTARADLADADWKVQDSPWRTGEPDYRRYWVRIARIRALTGRGRRRC
jgi:hypothetical protein